MRRDLLALPWHSRGQYFPQESIERLRASQVMLVLKNQPGNAGEIRDGGLTLGRSPGGGNGNPLQ